MKFQGSFPALVTPFRQNYAINFSELQELLALHQRYSDGIVVLGSTGEGWLLSDLEQRQVVEQAVAHFEGTLIININCWSPDHFAQKVKLFESCLDKTTAFLLAAPPYLKLSSQQVADFFTDCAQVSPLPIIAYHIPSRNGIKFDETVIRCLSEHPNIVGIKETVAAHLRHYGSQHRLNVFAGEDSFLAEPFIEASINVGGNLFPDLFSACPEQINWERWQSLLGVANNPLVIKELMFQKNMISFPGARPPLRTLSPEIGARLGRDLVKVLTQPEREVELS